MPVMSIGEIKYMITLHKTSITMSVLEILDRECLQAIWEKHLEEIRIWTGAEFRPQIGSKKPHIDSTIVFSTVKQSSIVFVIVP